jgi:AcrR family transcriptional regulator
MPSRVSATKARQRALRSDSLANRELLLTVASAAVRRDGPGVTITSIAAEAGVGVGTFYRHFPTREALLVALQSRSYELVREHASLAADSQDPPLQALAAFFAQTIQRRDDLILPLHGGPIATDVDAVAIRTEISELLGQVLDRGQQDGSIRPDVSAMDIIIMGALLAEPLANVDDWDRLARRQASVYVAGLANMNSEALSGEPPSRAEVEAGFSRRATRRRPERP